MKNKKQPVKKMISAKSSPWRVITALTVATAIVGAYFYVVQSGGNDDKINDREKQVKNFTVEKTGAGANVDFSEKTQRIHQLVDAAIKESEADVVDIKELQRQVKRQKIEGNIIWDSREVILSATYDQTQKLQSRLEMVMNKINAEIIKAEDDKYDGHKALRLDIGVRDKLEGDSVTIIADKLYVLAKDLSKIPPTAKSPPKSNASASQGKDGAAKYGAKALKEMVPILESQGIKFVFVSTLLE